MKFGINAKRQEFAYVAPARERGLKYTTSNTLSSCKGRSRKGAWIEIAAAYNGKLGLLVAPARECELKF